MSRPAAEIILLILSLIIHDAYVGSLILIALMLLVCWGVAERTGHFNE